ncbi:MAG: hypothetical protein PHW35_15460, partial [Lentimicrobiaceae bacterium]|nr:hypothetical protein [Lentimicrobiaceae bacterium]
MAVFLMSNCLPVYADGIGDEQRSDYPGVTDYRQHPVSLNSSHQKPSARFSLQIKDSIGNLQPNVVDSGDIDLLNPTIVPEQDSPIINAAIGDSIIINDKSTKGSGSKIAQYDIQYRFTPKGEDRENHTIKSNIVNNFSSVK